jgi:hypothetical protein
MLGAVPDGACLSVAISTGRDWQGRVIFDAPRHRLHLGLPLDYPRLNAWPEWFATEPGRLFRIDDSDGDATGVRDGASLSEGVDVRLEAGAERRLRVCRLD